MQMKHAPLGAARRLVFAGGALSTLLLSTCAPVPGTSLPESVADVPGGSPSRGLTLINAYGCGSCHTVAGVPGAIGRLAPSLSDVHERKLIAGGLIPNLPERLILFIENPQLLKPGTAMPNVGVSREEARDIAAYLYALRER